MKIKVISYGKSKGIKTAQIVVNVSKHYQTIHVWQRNGKVYGDYIGNNYELPNS